MIDFSTITIEKSWRKSISLHLSPDGSILVRAPKLVPTRTIHHFIEQHEEWIIKKRAFLSKRPKTIKHTYTEGDTLLYLGIPRTLTIGSYPTIVAEDKKLLFPKGIQFRIQKELEDWYIKQAKKVITERVVLNAKEMNVSYGTLMFSDTKSKWGSCSPEDNLQFNWRLIMAPIIVLNYVVVHELAHTLVKNHSARFWSTVEKYNPSYRQQRKWLKAYGDTLVL